jgi:hypothetical protein
MGVMARVLQAFLLAAPTRQLASHEDFPQHRTFDQEVPSNNRTGHSAHIGAIEIEPDTPGEHPGVVLGERRIRAGSAGLRAIVAFFDAADQCCVRFTLQARMFRDHFLYMHGACSFRQPVALARTGSFQFGRTKWQV